MTESSLDYALRYAGINWPVLPLRWIGTDGFCSCGNKDCKSPGKHPLVSRGIKDASKETEIIKGWFKKWPLANIGVVTGKDSKILALDIDPRHGGDDELDKLVSQFGRVPNDVMAVTGSGGAHYIFNYPGEVGRCATNLYPGIDIRGEGGYIVVAPSNHMSGQSYFWDAEADPLAGAIPPKVPDWLLSKLAEKTKTAPTEKNTVNKILTTCEVQKVRAALGFVSAEDREQWRKIGMALHSTNAGEQAFGLWCEWSQQSDKFDLKDQRRVWMSFKIGGGVTLAALFGIAKDYGWVLPEVHKANTNIVNRAEPDGEALLNPPPILRSEAYHGILRDVVRIACRSSEASPVAVAVNFIATFSAMIGRVPFQHIGDGTCHARPFFLITGRTGKARKGTAEFTVRRIFNATEQLLGEDYPPLRRHDGGLSTGEGLGWVIRDKVQDDDGKDNGGTDDKRLYVVEAEFGGAMAAAARDKNTLSATIRSCWDGRDIAPLVKNAAWIASSPHIVIAGHITAPELIDRMSDVDALSGFLNRFVILHVARAKLVPMPEPTPSIDIDRIAADVASAVCFAVDDDVTGRNINQITMTHDAVVYWCQEYPALTEEQPGIAGALLVRTEIYARMFAMIFALLDKTNAIEVRHIKAALAWIDYWRSSVIYIFQTLSAKAEAERLNESAIEVLEFIRQHPKCSRTSITLEFKNKLSGGQVTAVLNHLMSAAPPLVRQEKIPRVGNTPGRGSSVFWVSK